MTLDSPETSKRPLIQMNQVILKHEDPTSSERLVLASIELSIEGNERLGLVGPSGAGKTSLAALLAGLLDPTSGEIFDVGVARRPQSGPPLGHVGLVFQEAESSFFEETVLQEVSFGPKNLGMRSDETLRRAEEALDLVGLSPREFGPRRPESLSGGEARRVALASALAFRPRLLVLDEPTLGLDADGVVRLRSLLDSLHARGTATLVISHDLGFVLDVCDRVMVLEEGRITWDGAAAHLSEHLPSPWGRTPEVCVGEMLILAEMLRQQGNLERDVVPTPEELARAWASTVGARRN